MTAAFKRELFGLAVGLAGAAAVTSFFTRVMEANSSTAGFFYLMVVLGVATWAGFRAAALVSLVAMLSYNFFYMPPVGRFTISDPENWVALFTFLVTALVASHLSDRAQKQAAEALRRQQETEQLYALSRAILLTDPARPIGTQAAQAIAQIFSSQAVLVLDAASGKSFQGGAGEVAGWESKLEEAVRVGGHVKDGALDVWPITLGGKPIGALGAVEVHASDGAVQSMLNLVAIALERVRMEEATNRAEAARQSEEFKSTLLDAIAHEFKTPLTSIKAAAGGLRAVKADEAREELSQVIEEEADRLSGLVSQAVRMAEIDAGKVQLHRGPVGTGDLLEAVHAGFAGRGGERVVVGKVGEASLVVDRELMELAVRQVVDNALKYAPAGTLVRLGGALANGRYEVRVEDCGEGIAQRERERIFEKFYRLAGTRTRIPGSGLGLHIARELTRMHGGDLWVEDVAGGGAAFVFALPLEGAA